MLSFRFRWREIYYRFTLSLKIYLSITWRAQTLMCPGQTWHLLIWLFILPNTSSTGKGRKEFGTQSSTYVTLIHNIQALSLEEIIVLLDERLHMEITNTHTSVLTIPFAEAASSQWWFLLPIVSVSKCWRACASCWRLPWNTGSAGMQRKTVAYGWEWCFVNDAFLPRL